MKIWKIVVTGLVGLALAGCRSDPTIERLERENSKLQWEIHQQQNRIEDLEDALNAAAPVQPGILRGVPPGEMPPEPGTTEGGRFGPAVTRPAPLSSSPGRSGSQPETSPPPGLNISPGLEVTPGEVPDRMRVPGSSPPPQVSPPGGSSSGGSTRWNPAGGQPLGSSALADNGPVAQITLHPALTGGIGSGGQSGDEGLLVVVEPRDFGGNIVTAPGDINVVLLDPALSGQRARLARWDFAAAETQGMIRTGSQPGIHLRLPWSSTPAHDRLKVFVRYTTRDGRKLQAERLIAVALDGPPPVGPVAIPDVEGAQTAARPQRPQWSPVR
jgi:hypothetical protein